ncbi:MerR family transcriptional regulator [Luteococcus sp. H138]|uniref:helix-turn-helix domain-containing protein n=1 Tax=unclassified Luteococcus TaxID=2639923 RepID=UPI00313C1CE6
MPTIPSSEPIPSGRLHIGEVARLTGLSLRSIRHYEDMGLVQPPSRTVGGFRVYDSECVERLRLVMSLKVVGLSLEEMLPIVDACRASECGPGTNGPDHAVLAEAAHLVEQSMADLQARMDSARGLRERLVKAAAAARQAI